MEKVTNISSSYTSYAEYTVKEKNRSKREDRLSSKLCVYARHVVVFATPWTVACQASLFMEFSRQEYWSGLPFPIPGDLPNRGVKPISIESPLLAGRFFTTALSGKSK